MAGAARAARAWYRYVDWKLSARSRHRYRVFLDEFGYWIVAGSKGSVYAHKDRLVAIEVATRRVTGAIP